MYDILQNYQNYYNTANSFDDHSEYKDCVSKIEDYFGIPIQNIVGRLNNADRLYEVFFNKVLKKYMSYCSQKTRVGLNDSFKFMDECKMRGFEFCDDLVIG